MIWLYLGLALLGGGVLALRLVHGDVDGLDEVPGGEGGEAMLVLSLSFWSYASLAAGLCGLLCEGLDLLSGWRLGVLTATLGLGCGAATTVAMRALRRGSRSTTVDSSTVVGQVGRVRVPPQGGAPGQVRLRVGGQLVDLLAESDDEALEAGEEVLGMGVQGARGQVARMEVLTGEGPPTGKNSVKGLPSKGD
jgi:hypothetical protein